MRKHTCRRWGLTVAATLALQACGGGGGSSGDTGNNPVVPTESAHAQGTVYDASTGQVLANVTIELNGETVTTDKQGQFDLKTVANQSVNVRATLPGYTEGQARLDVGAQGGSVAISLPPVGQTTTLDIATGGSVSLPGSANARVTLPASSLADAASNLAASGTVNVSLTAIDPAAQPDAMPGGYLAADGTTIESFGAIQVKLSDARTGKALQLAAGKTATIRIPVRTRTSDLPAEIQLYSFNSGSGQWELAPGSKAQLHGDDVNGHYYEGTVSHFSTWDAARPIAGSVTVQGCVRDEAENIPPAPVSITAEGLDYSGQTRVNMAADGSFILSVKSNARVRLTASGARLNSTAATVTTGTSKVDLSRQCLVLSAPPVQPEITQQPDALTPVVVGKPALLAVSARGTGLLRYQWHRGPVDLLGQTAPVLPLSAVTMDDDGAEFSVTVTNGQGGSKTSAPFKLRVMSQDMYALKTLTEGIAMTLPLSISAAATGRFSLLPISITMLAPSDVCGSGELRELLFDDKVVVGGEKVVPVVPHELQVDFAACAPKLATGNAAGDVLDGKVVSSFVLDNRNGTLANSAELNLTDITRGMHVTGRFSSNFVGTKLSAAPSSGATLTHETGDGKKNTLTFTGGEVRAAFSLGSSSSTVTFENLRFTLQGVSYGISGAFSMPPLANDDLSLKTSDGKTIARMRFSQEKGQFVEITGTVPVF